MLVGGTWDYCICLCECVWLISIGLGKFYGRDEVSHSGAHVHTHMLIVYRLFFLFSFFFFLCSSSRYTDTVMNSYQSMSVPASASASFAQFYQHAAAASAVSAASAGAIGVDSLGNACTQPSSGVVPGAGGAGQSIADLPRYPWMTLTGESLRSQRNRNQNNERE